MKQTAMTEAVRTALAGKVAKEEAKARTGTLTGIAASKAKQPTGADTVKAKADAKKAAEALKTRMAEVSPVAQVIADAIGSAEDAGENVWAFIRDARLSGYSFDELEAVTLKGLPEVQGRKGMRAQTLKDLPRYRKAKQRINGLAEKGVILSPEMSSYEADQAAKTPKGKSVPEADDGVTVSEDGADKALHFTDKQQVLKIALQTLKEDATERGNYASEIRAIAKALANDEATAKAAADKAAKSAKAHAAKDLKGAIAADKGGFSAADLAEAQTLLANGVRIAA